MNSLKGKLIKGGFWVGLQRLSTMLFNFVKLTILTHYLLPSEFGVFGVALLSLDILDSFSRPGFGSALIQKKGNITEYLNSVWTFKITRSVLVATVLFLLAPFAAAFFNSPESVLVIRAVSVVFVVRAFVNIADLYLVKNLDFKTNFFYITGGNLVDVILAIVFAVILKNYWALFIGYFSRAVFKCTLSYIIFSFRPKFEFDFKKIKELFQFGKWILASSIIVVLAMHLDNILVGKLIGVAALGLYQVAFRFAHTGSGELNNVLSQIFFPYFSAIQENKKESEKAYLSLLKMNIIAMSMFVTGMVCLAPSFTLIFFDNKWHSIIGIIQILALASFFNSIIASGNPFFKGIGNPKFVLFIQITKVVSLVIFIILLSDNLGVKGIAYSVLIAEMFAFVVWGIILWRNISDFFIKLIKIFIAPTIASVIMAGSISMFWIIPGIEFMDLSLTQFLCSGFLGSAVFILFMNLYIKLFPGYGVGIKINELFRWLIRKQNG